MQPTQLQVQMGEDPRKGRYSNFIQLTQSAQEAILDFLIVHPNTGGELVARIVVTPDFLERLGDLLKSASQQVAAKPPSKDETKVSKIGFRVEDTEVSS